MHVCECLFARERFPLFTTLIHRLKPGGHLKHGIQTHHSLDSDARSVMTPTDVARRARGTAIAVVIHHDHRLHCGGVQVLGAGGLHHLKIGNCEMNFSCQEEFLFTFPAS